MPATRVTLWSAHDGVRSWTAAGTPGHDPATLSFDPRGRPVTAGDGITVRDLHTGEPVPAPSADRADRQLLGLTPVRAGSLDRYLGPTRPVEEPERKPARPGRKGRRRGR